MTAASIKAARYVPGATVTCTQTDVVGALHLGLPDGEYIFIAGQEYVIAQEQEHDFLLWFDRPDGTPVTVPDGLPNAGNRICWGINHFRVKDALCPECDAPPSNVTAHVVNDRIAVWSCGDCDHVWNRGES